MKRFHALVLERYEIIIDLMQAEVGKARRMAFEEVCDVAMTTSHYLKVAPRVLKERKHGGVVPVVSTSTEVRVPKGVVGLISPWNFPFAISLSDSMPALIAGNGVVMKPDNKSTLCVVVRRLAALRSRAARGPGPDRLRRGPGRRART